MFDFILVEQLLAPLTRPVHPASPVPLPTIINDLGCRALRFHPLRLSPIAHSAYEVPGRTLTENLIDVHAFRYVGLQIRI